MNTDILSSNRINALLTEAVERGEFFGASWGVAEAGHLSLAGSAGQSAQVYDLASLTKPLATGLLAAVLRERGMLDFEEPVATYLPELKVPDKSGIRVWHLLTHSAGFPAWRPLYALADTPQDALSVMAGTPCEYPTGNRVIYSDLGFLTLGFLLERLTGLRLDGLFEQEIARPLGLENTSFNPPADWQPRIAPTEVGNAHERELIAKIPLNQSERERVAAYGGWRTALIRGEVHDGNAHFLRGVAGHAGLFSSVEDACVLAAQFLPGSRLLPEHSLEMFARSRTSGLEEERSIAWMLAGTRGSSAGEALPTNAFGHTGFTGTSIWIDPQATRIYILFTNRTYPIGNLHPTRREFHKLASEALRDQP